MSRLTGRKEDGHAYVIGCPEFKVPQKVNILLQSIADKCADVEDILGDTYDLDRLRELVAADRSGWEPCDFCGKELDDYPYIVAHSDYYESDTCYTPAFCPVCGRPLTDAAWDMLERRLLFEKE